MYVCSVYPKYLDHLATKTCILGPSEGAPKCLKRVGVLRGCPNVGVGNATDDGVQCLWLIILSIRTITLIVT